MELLVPDRRSSNVAEFHQEITPFPTTGTFLVSTPTAGLFSPDVNHNNLPPQKLLPIRGSSERSPSNSQHDYPPLLHQPSMEARGILDDGTLGNLGLLSDIVVGDMAVDGGGMGGCEGVLGICPVRVGSYRADPNYEVGLSLDVESSSSSDGDDCGDSLKAAKESASRKRRRKSKKKLKGFLENAVVRIMEKQEQMHQKLIDAIEKSERERIIREDAWKRQETERIKREQDVRAQETARNLSLISFIQNIVGHDIEVPQPLTPSSSPPVETSGDKDGDNLPIQQDSKCNLNDKRWPPAEVNALIRLRAASEQSIQFNGSKCPNVWDDISAKMHSMGYDRSAKKCKEKWENINKYFRKSMGNGTCPYFHELNILYKNGNGVVGSVNPSDHINNENEVE
ncbi:hypothetical protein K2173_018050 [Erythroxylum novogranatense]|uniref:Myb-like domain-containing protein n=1 Tax=Erythroxylum novogranatense TaxID=1862640 RepID=A0AAV8TX10_9ROSI|nr:hypothetical protein K2173_018050 [Erythroxylum novogranatense]